MSDSFRDREDTFEKRFANDEALRFRAVARRNKAVALWVAEMTPSPAIRTPAKNSPVTSRRFPDRSRPAIRAIL